MLIKKMTKNNAALSVTSRYLSLFPNFIMGTYFPNQVGVYLNVPISPGVTSQKRIIYTTDGKNMSKEEIDTIKNIWWSVHKEDHEMCERLQEGRSSPASNEGGSFISCLGKRSSGISKTYNRIYYEIF